MSFPTDAVAMVGARGIQPGLQVTLPVSGRRVVVRSPTGAEDLLLLETGNDDNVLALRLMTCLAQPLGAADEAEDDIEWSHLTATDLDVFILRLRQSLLGDRVVSDVRCQAHSCEQRIDITFGIDDYISHYFPARASRRGRGWAAEAAAEPGWFELVQAAKMGGAGTPAAVAIAANTRVLFRLPTVADLMAVTGVDEAATELARRCIRPSAISGRQRRRVEAAMEALAPNLSQDLQGACPECGTGVSVFFNPRRYCLRELRDRAAFVYEDVDMLARRYHWTESDILALPCTRRMNYIEVARQEGSRLA